MTDAGNVTNSERLDEALRQIRGITVDSATIRAHVMRPANVIGVTSDRGLDVEQAPTLAKHLDAGAPQETLGLAFDSNGFVKSIQGAFDDSVAGYVMRLNANGTPIATLDWNCAHEPQDTSDGWTTDVRFHVASLSKQPTAMATTKLLNDAGMSPNTPIASYLPDYWFKGPNVDQITFANLLTHTSGLDYGVGSSASDFLFMKDQIAAGTTHLGQFWYQNMNFGLCRILMSTINGNISPSLIVPPTLNELNACDVFWDVITLRAYQAYVHANVFGPSGVTDPTLAHETDDGLAYNFPVSGHGWNSGDLTTMAGSAGWHMTVDDVLNVMGTFRRAGTIMSPTQAWTMLDSRFGIDFAHSTPLGTLYAKNGGWQDNAGHLEQSVLFYLPEDMELVVFVNSPIGTPPQSLFSIVYGAYTDNIVARIPPPR